jgi:hypothetical protein
MVTRRRNLQQRDRDAILLAEYQVCHDDAASQGSTYWTMAAIFFGINVAFLAGLLYAILSSDTLLPAFMRAVGLFAHTAITDPSAVWLVRTLVSAIGGAAITMLYVLRRWQLRTNFLMNIDYTRMRQIERELTMWLSRTVDGADHWFDKEDSPKKLEESEKKELRASPFWKEYGDKWWASERFRRECPSSIFHAPAMFLTLAILWAGLIIAVWGLWQPFFFIHWLIPLLT